MRLLSEQLAALRRALAADQRVPRLVDWATGGQLRATALDVRSMRDWAARLLDDAELSSAFESMLLADVGAWTRFSEKCSARMAHHHALLFGRLATRLEEAHAFEDALRLHRWSRQAWSGTLADPTYTQNLLASLKTESSYEAASVFGGVFSSQLTSYEGQLKQALALETCSSGAIATDHATFVTRLLDEWDQEGFPLAQPAENARQTLSSVRHTCLDVLGDHLDALDVVEASDEALTEPWTWLHEVLEIVGASTAIAAGCLTRVVDFLWHLRKLERDDASVVRPILDATRPHVTTLTNDLQDDTAFGLQGRIADYLVFVGEREEESRERRAIFEHGLQICPGHRNSAKLLSYEYLRDVESTLVQLTMIPRTATRLAPVTSRARTLLKKASVELDRVEEAFAFNEEIPDMRATIEEHRERLNLEESDER